MTVLALPRLYSAVVAQFAADSVVADQYFGWREVAKHYPRARIVWVPGDPVGSIGPIVAPKWPGSRLDGRPLMNLTERFHVFITGYDNTAATDEMAQYTAARLLFDDFVRAVYLNAHGTFTLESSSWVTTRKEFRAGATVLVIGTVQAVQPDRVVTGAPVDTGIIAQIEMLDLTEELRVPADHVPATP
jgi:hypothetical protein